MQRFIVLAYLASVGGAYATGPSDIRSVFVKESEIWVAKADGSSAHVVTRDGRSKSLPVWSPDGEKIAFVRESDGDALAELVIVDRSGSVTMQHPFRSSTNRSSGMRFIESLGWLSEKALLVAGSVDPSTVEYAVVDTGSGLETGGYLADGFSVKPSPDGKHVAYQGYIPHFVREEDRKPQFCLDHECEFDRPWHSYPGTNQKRLDLVSDFQWSPESSGVAAVEEDSATQQALVVIRGRHGETSTYSLPLKSSGDFQVEWTNEAELVAAAQTGSWKVDRSTGALVPMAHLAAGMPQSLQQMRRTLRAALTSVGNQQADLWCEACALSTLPRRNGPREAQ